MSWLKGMAPGVGALLVFFLYISPPSYSEPQGVVLQVCLRESGRIIWEKSAAPEDRFYLTHRNSIYDALVWEAFRIDSQGAIWLIGVKTKCPAVLEYYGLEACTSDWISLSRKIGHIPLLVTALGETRLHWNRESLDLSGRFPEGSLIEIRTGTFSKKRD